MLEAVAGALGQLALMLHRVKAALVERALLRQSPERLLPTPVVVEVVHLPYQHFQGLEVQEGEEMAAQLPAVTEQPIQVEVVGAQERQQTPAALAVQVS
jgi:hypothetical protein